MSELIEKKKQEFHLYVKDLQDQITQELQGLDPEIQLEEDLWERTDYLSMPGGGGRTRAFKGNIIENAGVNTSCVFGKIDPQFADKLKGNGDELWAAGISLIIHPRNPKVPTTHANFRMIQQGDQVWFGGGGDLTPYYPFEQDFKDYHQVWKSACAPYGVYEDWKKQCDEYFVNHHREGEMRGIGGIFFDHYNSGDFEKDYSMVVDISKSFIPSFFPLAHKRKGEEFSKEDEDFQLYRRGRYVEFNLLHDRGTMFGLKTKGRTESILISLPARCKFGYQYRPEKESIHEKMLSYYYPKAW